MRIGISGKGGVGKTNISAVLSRAFARAGHHVVAIDCDSDPNLAANSGVPEDQVNRMRPLLDQSGGKREVPTLGPTELLAGYGLTGPDGVTFVLGARAEKPGGG
ncbi:MAG: AAA family ATPase [Actinobacteria bacterium]|nr:AAA family ATPase [Actinomycetota bacterium]